MGHVVKFHSILMIPDTKAIENWKGLVLLLPLLTLAPTGVRATLVPTHNGTAAGILCIMYLVIYLFIFIYIFFIYFAIHFARKAWVATN